jgi:hypothetical protein
MESRGFLETQVSKNNSFLNTEIRRKEGEKFRVKRNRGEDGRYGRLSCAHGACPFTTSVFLPARTTSQISLAFHKSGVS